jgi:hypothetical protein
VTQTIKKAASSGGGGGGGTLPFPHF